MAKLILNEAIYAEVIEHLKERVHAFLWVITADIKDMYVRRGRRSLPFIEVLAELLEEGKSVRLIHAKEPGERFCRDFDRFDVFLQSDNFERVLCPRVHTKAIIIDGKWAFIGSANLTGAGLGMKKHTKRNFEAGYITEEKKDIEQLMDWADALYLGAYCKECAFYKRCPDPML